jgi:oligosaccharide repeat unit polymerase
MHITAAAAFTADFEVHADAFRWLLVVSALILLGSSCAPGPSPRACKRVAVDAASTRMLRRALVACIIAACVYTLLSVPAVLRPALGTMSLEAVARVANANSVRRYSVEGMEYHLPTQILSAAVYLAGALAGILFALRRGWKDVIISTLALAPAAATAMVHTTRTSFLMAAAFWVANYTATAVYLRGPRRIRFSWRSAVLVIGLATLSLMILSAGDRFRIGQVPTLGEMAESLASPRLRTALFGHVSLFSIWFSQVSSDEELNYGGYTFAGPLDLLKLRVRKSGVYDDPLLGGAGVASNVYTVFRGIIADFGVAGAGVFLLLAAVVAGAAYKSTLAGGRYGVPILATWYMFVSWHIVSIFNYNTVILTTAAVWLFWACRRESSLPVRRV